MSAYFAAFEQTARQFANSPALIHPGRREEACSFAELLTRAYDFAEFAARYPGPVIPIQAAKSIDAISLSLGCLAADRAFCWLNKRLKPPQTAAIVHDLNAQCLVLDGASTVTLGQQGSLAPALKNLQLVVIQEENPTLARAVESAMKKLSGQTETGYLNSTSVVASQAGLNHQGIGCCLFTSGSTGQQKGVNIYDNDLLVRARTEAEWFGIEPQHRLLSLLPFSFDVGLNQLLSGLIQGATSVIQDSWLPKDINSTITQYGIHGVAGVPSIWQDFLRSNTPLSAKTLSFITVSGGSLTTQEQSQLIASAGNSKIFKTYGQTESFRSASLRPEQWKDRPASVGQAYPGTQILILDSNGNACQPNEVGEVVHIGDGTMAGYTGKEDLEKIRPLGSAHSIQEGVFTGDDGYLDEEGFLFLAGRKDSMLKIAGNRVYPDEVANTLRGLEGFDNIEIINVDADDGDPRLICFSTSVSLDASTLKRKAARHLPSYMLPAQYILVDEIPRLANGKPDRQTLLAMIQSCPI